VTPGDVDVMPSGVQRWFFEHWLDLVLWGTALIVAYVLYRLARRDPVPTAQSRALVVVSPSHAGKSRLRLRLKGRELPALAKTYIFIWNAGRQTITGADVKELIRVCFDFGTEVLEAEIVRQTRVQNDFAIRVEKECVTVSFDFMDQGDGVAIETLTTATEPYPTVTGVIRGVPNDIRVVAPQDANEFFGQTENTWSEWMLFIGIAYAAIVTFANGGPYPAWPFTGEPAFDIPMVSVFAVVAAYKFFTWLKRRIQRAPRSIWVGFGPADRRAWRQELADHARRADAP